MGNPKRKTQKSEITKNKNHENWKIQRKIQKEIREEIHEEIRHTKYGKKGSLKEKRRSN